MRVYLMGYMGCGKTTIGKKLAKLMKYNFIDLDEYIEKAEKKTINEIFEKQGEIKFRELETEILKKLSGQDNLIISLGGGTPCFNNNLQIIKKYGISIYIEMSPKSLFYRLKDVKNTRPLIKDESDDELMDYIQRHLNSRVPFYSQAVIVINGINVNAPILDNLVKEIIKFKN